ncbi:hypothetical protein HUU40_00170 [candidate division KSB1 bacterium]|nr:hypothetical protein [candidate division KSB1 bacterium]
MQIETNWENAPIGDGGEYLKRNAIVLARIWPVGQTWQIAVNLPDAKVPKHIHSSKQQAKNACAEAVKKWFDRIDA